MDAFSVAVAGAFLDPHQSREAVYIDLTQREYPVRVLPVRSSPVDPLLGEAGARQPTEVVDVLQSAIPSRPVEGETLEYLGKLFTIRGSEPDTLGVIWQLDLDPA